MGRDAEQRESACRYDCTFSLVCSVLVLCGFIHFAVEGSLTRTFTAVHTGQFSDPRGTIGLVCVNLSGQELWTKITLVVTYISVAWISRIRNSIKRVNSYDQVTCSVACLYHIDAVSRLLLTVMLCDETFDQKKIESYDFIVAVRWKAFLILPTPMYGSRGDRVFRGIQLSVCVSACLSVSVCLSVCCNARYP